MGSITFTLTLAFILLGSVLVAEIMHIIRAIIWYI